jgi:hypothetical protein
MFDVGIRKAAQDGGREPHVAATLWAAPGIAVAGAQRVEVQTFQRGRLPVDGAARLYLFHAPFGATHPLPRLDREGAAASQWRPLLCAADGSPGFVMVAAGDNASVETRGDVDLLDGTPRLIAAVLDHDQDRYEPLATLGMRNNIAVLAACEATITQGAAPGMPTVTIFGSDDVDSLLIWSENLDGALSWAGVPVTALPWRTARLFLEDEGLRSAKRPYFGQQDAAARDPANWLARETDAQRRVGDADPITALTGITGAGALALDRAGDDGFARLCATAAAGRLWVPRLRVAQGQALGIQLRLADAGVKDAGRDAWVHVVHFSGGRRVGGGSVHLTAALAR